MAGWNLPDDVSDNDPRAPWNADPEEDPAKCECGKEQLMPGETSECCGTYRLTDYEEAEAAQEEAAERRADMMAEGFYD
jgi:hypothetical protein